MIVLSMLLVIVGAVTLLIGALGDDSLQFIYVSIISCLLALLFLIIGIIRGRPSKKPVAASGEQEPSWAGAQSWAQRSETNTAVLEREERPSTSGVQVVRGESAAGTRGPSQHEAPAHAGEASPWRGTPEDEPATQDLGEDLEEDLDEVFRERARSAEETTVEEDVVVVPKRRGQAEPEPARTEAAEAPAGKRTTRKATAKKAAARPAEKAERAAKKTATKKATAKKATAKKTAAAGEDERGKIAAVLGDVSGVGPGKIDQLTAQFGTYRRLKNASVDRLIEVPGISRTLAERIHGALRAE